jgi:hypothetical protein
VYHTNAATPSTKRSIKPLVTQRRSRKIIVMA